MMAAGQCQLLDLATHPRLVVAAAELPQLSRARVKHQVQWRVTCLLCRIEPLAILPTTGVSGSRTCRMNRNQPITKA
jgi:hypothetical protein